MSSRTDASEPSPTYEWATNAEPDFLVLQLPTVPVVADDGPRDAMTALFVRRGFRPVSAAPDAADVTEDVRLDLQAANGCVLTRVGPGDAELLVTISAQVGASRFPLEGLDPRWLARVVESGHTAVLVVRSAVRDGATTKEDLRRDVDAGGVVAALVPCADPAGRQGA